MNYEKKYNELIEKLKKAKIEAGAYTFKSVIDKYISELKESEDEKIRKALINFLKSPFVNENITDEKVNPWIAWLEKQGEEILILKDQIESLHAAIKAIKETYQIEQKKQYEQKLAEEYNITGINSKHAEGKLGEMIKRKLEMEKQGEQKPADNIKLKFNVGQTIKKKGFNLGFTIVKIEDGFYYNDMGDNFPFTDQDNWELIEQNPTWDEEDDQYLLVCENALRKYQTSDKWDADIISHWLENKLKAHQAIWKPSDDQIEILDMILTNESMDDNVARILRELREQLKKLKD